MSDKIYTVLELNTEVRELIKEKFSGYIWVCGEIQGVRTQPGKNHMYFSLVQKDPDSDRILAQIDANLFAGNRLLIERRIQEAKADFQLKDDIEVKFLCEVDLYTVRGKFNVNIKDIDPVYTLGKVAQNRLKVIEELKKKGIFEKNKLHTLPLLPLKAGLITAHDSAAYHDFINELSLSGFSFKVLAVNCHMQGKLVETDVLRALKIFNRLNPNELDVIIVTRGGGSIADLSYFDNKKIAEAIASSNFPVISAIGHQINTTIADMVSHTSCKTPTKAAQFLIEKIKNFIDILGELQQNIFSRSQELLRQQRQEAEGIAVKIDSLTSRYFRGHREGLLKAGHELSGITGIIFTKEGQQIKAQWHQLKSIAEANLRNNRKNLSYLESKVLLLDPKNVLKRGYSMTLKDNKVVKSTKDAKKADVIRTVLYDGSLLSRVESLLKD
ncbi:MAG: exodeoxyribonuclease VII large subunit [Candidatus Omnitrophica bacterium]|nr:exodeoxyribonuclease VII large subunit [Candidatus Omnitrophota bacterium]MDD5429442.1 exodeoxyribonuclease VII large subunit [Candidatus Omnitrophota bacterium]